MSPVSRCEDQARVQGARQNKSARRGEKETPLAQNAKPALRHAVATAHGWPGGGADVTQIKVLVGCQVQGCAEEVSYHLDMVKLWKGQPICQNCYEEAGHGDILTDWTELSDILLKDLCV